MNWLEKLAAAAALLTAMASFAAGGALAASPFPDKNLEAAIRDVLKHEPNVELTDEKLQNVYILEAPGKGIKDLTGLEKCKNLALLKLTKNQVTDLKPIKDLVNLESLDLADNAIKDIAPLANLKGLQYIELSNNKIEDVSPLGGLTALSALYLGGNAIQDIAPLAPLVKLSSLSLGKNRIKQIGVLEKVTKLSVLDLRDNQVEDIGPLAKQTELKLLMIERNAIKDLKPLVDAAKADADGPKRFAPYLRLYIAGNPVVAGFDLRLMPSVNDISDIPRIGKNLIVVASVRDVLHFRIFAVDGKVAVDTDETRLTGQAQPIKDLRKQLQSLWPPHQRTQSENDRVISAVTSIVGHTTQLEALKAAGVRIEG
jgi:Leucine-rich repeat (LRR) protein